MRLNSVEMLMMNNPVRAAIQRRFEAHRLLDMGGRLAPGSRVLEIGCGRGVGVEILFERFGADRVDAFDLDPEMVERARPRLARFGDRLRMWTGSATDIEAGDATYDAVFDFGILHHVPAWRDALSEIARVLRPGGRLYAEEVMATFIHHPVWRRLLDHPMHDRFDAQDFAAALSRVGLQVIETRSLANQFAWFVADKVAPSSAS